MGDLRTGQELARQVQALAALEDEKALTMADYSLRIKQLKAEIGRLAEQIRTGQQALPLRDPDA